MDIQFFHVFMSLVEDLATEAQTIGENELGEEGDKKIPRRPTECIEECGHQEVDIDGTLRLISCGDGSYDNLLFTPGWRSRSHAVGFRRAGRPE